MTNLEGRVIRRRRVVDPPRGVRTDLRDPARHRAGARIARQVSPPRPRAVFDELRQATRRRAADYSGITYGADRSPAGRLLAVPVDGAARARRASSRIASPPRSGRARFHACSSTVRLNGPIAEYPLLSDDRPRAGAVPVGHADAPRQPAARARRARPMAEMHPRAAQRSGLADGDEVTIETRRGRAAFRLKTTQGIREDTVFVPFHWGGRAVGEPPDESRARSDQPDAGVQGLRGAGCRDRNGGLSTMRTRSRLVVIGNGMAGARLVEDVVARDAAARSTITDVRRRAVRQLQPHPAVGRARRARTTRRTSSSTRSPGTSRTACACTPACA